jgi:hypothetical protein
MENKKGRAFSGEQTIHLCRVYLALWGAGPKETHGLMGWSSLKPGLVLVEDAAGEVAFIL